jgi:AraC-like DNA-binding protein
MPKLAFASDDLPRHLDSAARASAWIGQLEATYKVEVDAFRDVPFRASFEGVLLGDTTVSAQRGSLCRFLRTKRALAADGRNSSILIINRGVPIKVTQRGQELVLGTGDATLFDEASAGGFDMANPGPDTVSILFPRAAFSAAVRNSDDLVLKPVDTTSEAFRMLKMYAKTLFAEGGPDDPATANSVGSHLIDLVALTLGAHRDAAETARQGGLRAGRLNAMLAAINEGFAAPEFSIRALARQQNVSERYLSELLHQSGTSFGDRVLELRLQQAYRLLTHWQHGNRKISDIALSSGFNDLSYFHRAFRRRFGMTPGDARAAAVVAALPPRG